MKLKTIATIFLLVGTNFLFGQNQSGSWQKWEFLIGEWKGAGSGKPGLGNGTFSFKPDLDGNILVRRNRTEFPATNNKPAFNHDDLLIVYKNDLGIPSKAIYFDNENHIINYEVSYSADSIILTSGFIQNVPRFRLTYTKFDDMKLNVRFEISSSQNPDDFKTYLEGQASRL